MNDSQPSDSRGPLIETVGVRKVFRSPKEPLRVLDAIDMQVQPGEILGIVGASGVGKSTLLHILGGLDRPTGGQVLFRGQDIFAQKNGFLDTFRNTNVGFVFQFFNLLPEFTVLENTLFPSLIGNKEKTSACRRAEQLLEQVGLKERMTHKPGELSGGESQRVALARALMNQPELLLADEPTGNLDTQASDSLMALIHNLNREFRQTFVIVTHSQRLAKKMDRVLQLAGGKIRPIDKEVII
ncbi:MAG: ABC transporter ATP-binding protein [Nitrospinales bacterium]